MFKAAVSAPARAAWSRIPPRHPLHVHRVQGEPDRTQPRCNTGIWQGHDSAADRRWLHLTTATCGHVRCQSERISAHDRHMILQQPRRATLHRHSTCIASYPRSCRVAPAELANNERSLTAGRTGRKLPSSLRVNVPELRTGVASRLSLSRGQPRRLRVSSDRWLEAGPSAGCAWRPVVNEASREARPSDPVASHERLSEAPPVLATLGRLSCDSAARWKRTERSPRLPPDLRAGGRVSVVVRGERDWVDEGQQACIHCLWPAQHDSMVCQGSA